MVIMIHTSKANARIICTTLRVRETSNTETDLSILPSGVIGTNKKDAQDTVERLFEDLEAGSVPEPAQPEPEAVDALLRDRKPDHVTYRGWEAIDRAEVERGRPQGRPRVKFCRIDEMVEVAAREADPVAG